MWRPLAHDMQWFAVWESRKERGCKFTLALLLLKLLHHFWSTAKPSSPQTNSGGSCASYRKLNTLHKINMKMDGVLFMSWIFNAVPIDADVEFPKWTTHPWWTKSTLEKRLMEHLINSNAYDHFEVCFEAFQLLFYFIYLFCALPWFYCEIFIRGCNSKIK